MEGTVLTGPRSVTSTPPQDAHLLRVLDERLGEAARRAGEHLVCRAGCTPCCIGPFPITRLDALRLADGLDALRRDDPARAERVVDRARAAVDLLRDGFPGDPVVGRLGDDDEAEETFLERHAALPCPVLDPDTGTCDLYAHRPVSCRTFGPPVRLGGEALPPCYLCFIGAPADEIARCRVEPDPDGVEDAILDRLEDGEDQTLVAYALAGSATSGPRGRGRRGSRSTQPPRR